jgi:hypothetical protein
MYFLMVRIVVDGLGDIVGVALLLVVGDGLAGVFW